MQQNTLPFPKKCEHRYAATATKLFTLRTPVETNNEAQGGCSDGEKYYYQAFVRRDNASDQEHNRVSVAKIDLESLCRAVGIKRVRVIDPYDLAQCDAVIKEELSANEPSVIISRRPCALLKYVKHNKPLTADPDKCVGCKACMKIGCPAISIVDGKAKVDETLCVGCGVCEQLCKFGALQNAKEG